MDKSDTAEMFGEFVTKYEKTVAERVSPFLQKEAMCLMWYQCKKCGVREQLWNSRPRVTPFIINCSACNGSMHHVDWHLDSYAPNFKPQKGQRIFVDLSREAYKKYKCAYIENYWNDETYPMSEQIDLWKSKEEALQYFVDRWEFGHPAVETVSTDTP